MALMDLVRSSISAWGPKDYKKLRTATRITSVDEVNDPK